MTTPWRACLVNRAGAESAGWHPDASSIRGSAASSRWSPLCIDKGELRPWGGAYGDYRTVSGMRVPFEAEVTWQLESGPCTYAHWLVDAMDHGEATPVDAR